MKLTAAHAPPAGTSSGGTKDRTLMRVRFLEQAETSPAIAFSNCCRQRLPLLSALACAQVTQGAMQEPKRPKLGSTGPDKAQGQAEKDREHVEKQKQKDQDKAEKAVLALACLARQCLRMHDDATCVSICAKANYDSAFQQLDSKHACQSAACA